MTSCMDKLPKRASVRVASAADLRLKESQLSKLSGKLSASNPNRHRVHPVMEQVALKAADVGHLAAPLAIHQRSTALSKEEFFRH